MRQTIQFRVYKGEKYYVGECLDLPIITQGKKIDETLKNIKEALILHLDGEDLKELGFSAHPSVLVHFELEPLYA